MQVTLSFRDIMQKSCSKDICGGLQHSNLFSIVITEEVEEVSDLRAGGLAFWNVNSVNFLMSERLTAATSNGA